MERTQIAISKLKANKGQIVGLPTNPRQWSQEDVAQLAKSIEETPELLEARGIIVLPYGKEFIILGGNMRLAALKKLGHKEAPCIVLPEDTPVEKLKEIVIKDNGSFGKWDMDALGNEWDDLPLSDWGVDIPEEWGVKVDDDKPIEEDDFDEEAAEVTPLCQRGDVWQLGEHRLMCGDSTSDVDVEKLMNGEIADITFTSPPYNAGFGCNIMVVPNI